MVSAFPGLAPAVSLLSTYQTKSSPGHLDAAKHVGCYVKASAHLGLEYSFDNNIKLKPMFIFPSIPRLPNLPFPLCPLPLLRHLQMHTGDHRMPPCQIMTILNKCQQRKNIPFMATFSSSVGLLSSDKVIRKSATVMVCVKWRLRRPLASLPRMYDISRMYGKGLLLLDLTVPTTIYNDNKGVVDWANTTSTKNMWHINISESCVHKSSHEFHEIKVVNIGGKLNPAVFFFHYRIQIWWNLMCSLWSASFFLFE